MFDIHQSICRDEEIDADLMQNYIDGMMNEFAQAPEAQPILDKLGAVGWAGMMMDYAANYIGVTPADMTPNDFDEVLFELFPRKVSTPATDAPAIVAELLAFWKFVQRQYGLPNANKILATFDHSTAAELQRQMANPACYGPAKAMVMMGIEAGIDMSTQEGMNKCMALYNQRLLEKGPPPDRAFVDEFAKRFNPLLPDRSATISSKKDRDAKKRERQAKKRNRKR